MTLSVMILTILALIIILTGLLGIFIPVIPGLIFLFLGSWILGYAYNYEYLGVKSLIAIFIISCVGFILDYISGILGAKFTKASKKALIFSFIGGILGCFFPPLGLILGPIIGAVLGEFYQNKNLINSGKVGIGTFIGICIGLITKVSCALIIMLIIIFSLFKLN